MTDETDNTGRWEFPDDGFTVVHIGGVERRVRHTTLRRTVVDVHGSNAADAFSVASEWFQKHPNARVVAVNGPHYGSGKWNYMTGNLCQLSIEVSWVSEEDIEAEYGE